MAGSGKRDAGTGDFDELSELDDVVAELRADVPVRRAWREDVLAEVRELAGQGARGGAGRTKGWTISPPTAIAAALAFTALGAVAAAGVFSVRDNDRQTAARPLEALAPPSAL